MESSSILQMAWRVFWMGTRVRVCGRNRQYNTRCLLPSDSAERWSTRRGCHRRAPEMQHSGRRQSARRNWQSLIAGPPNSGSHRARSKRQEELGPGRVPKLQPIHLTQEGTCGEAGGGRGRWKCDQSAVWFCSSIPVAFRQRRPILRRSDDASHHAPIRS